MVNLLTAIIDSVNRVNRSSLKLVFCYRSIKLGEVSYDSAPSTPQHRDKLTNGLGGPGGGRARIERGGSVDMDTSLRAGDSLESGLSVYDEVQMMRRQLAKLNHRLMAVELENQQQQQREMVRHLEMYYWLHYKYYVHSLDICTPSADLRFLCRF